VAHGGAVLSAQDRTHERGDLRRQVSHPIGRILSPQDRGVRLATLNGKDWAGRFPTIVDAAAQLKPRSCLIDGEMVRYDAGDIERALAAVPRNQNSGLIVIARALGLFVTAGSLISYGPDAIEMTYRIVRTIRSGWRPRIWLNWRWLNATRPARGSEAWRNRPIEGEHPYVYLDGIVLKRSWVGEVRNVSLLVAIGVNESGYHEILGICGGEGRQNWLERVPQASQGTRVEGCPAEHF
jgi:hypothetical protein